MLSRLLPYLARVAAALPIGRPGLHAPGAAAPALRAGPTGEGPGRTVARALLRRSLSASIAEGAVGEVFTAVATGAVVTGWALHLGADPVLVGALSALPLAAQVVHLPSAWLTSRYGRRRVALTAITGARLVWAPMALMPWLGLEPSAARTVLGAIALTSAVLAVIGNNAWTAWMGDLIPSRLRGRFFGRRMMWVTGAGALASLTTGLSIDLLGDTHQQFVLAALSGIGGVSGLATLALLRVQVEPGETVCRTPPIAAFRGVLRDRRARVFLGYQLAWGAAIAPAASYWSLHVLANLRLGFMFLAVHGLIAAAVRIATAGMWGRAVDRRGARPVLAICSMGIGAMPLLWLFATPSFVWPLVLDAVIAGCLWGGHGIAALDWPLSIAPRRERPFYLAVFASAAGVGFASSAAISGVVLAAEPAGDAASTLGWLFFASAVGRFSCGAWVWTKTSRAIRGAVLGTAVVEAERSYP